MSPPVLGTLLGLTIAYILPVRDGKPPMPCPWGCIPPTIVVAETDGTDRTRPIKEEYNTIQTSVRLGSNHKGICGIHLRLPEDCGKQCYQCNGLFSHFQVIYSWRDMAGKLLYFHEECLMDRIGKWGSDREAFDSVQILMSQTDTDELLNSLFNIHDDLTRECAWSIDNPDSDGEVHILQPSKMRRIQ